MMFFERSHQAKKVDLLLDVMENKSVDEVKTFVRTEFGIVNQMSSGKLCLHHISAGENFFEFVSL